MRLRVVGRFADEDGMKTVALLLFFVAGASSAANWYIVRADDARAFLVDLDSIADVSGYKKIWTKEFLFKERPIPSDTFKSYVSQVGLWYYDCKEKKTSVPANYFYNKDGEVIGGTTRQFKPSQMEDVIPDSIGEEIGKIACEPDPKLIAMRRKLAKLNATPLHGAIDALNDQENARSKPATEAPLFDDQIFDAFNKGTHKAKVK